MEPVTSDKRQRESQGAVRVLLRPEEGAQAVGVSRSQFFKMLSDGTIRSIKVGRLRRVPIAEIDKWVTQQLSEQSA